MAETPAKPPEKPPEKPVDAQWSCTAKDLPEPMTVGVKFNLQCEGPPVALDRETLALEIAPESRWTLRLLETKSLGDTGAEFVATTWTAGQLKIKDPVLSDGKKRVGLGTIELNVTSVIKPEENPESKPFGPVGPMTLPLPAHIWIILVMLFAFIGLVFVSWLRRRLKRRKFMALLEGNRSALSPYNQFNKDLRKLSREISPAHDARATLSELNDAFRWFLARELLVPSIGTRPAVIASDFKRAHRGRIARDEKLPIDLRVALAEIEKALGAKKPVLVDEQLQLVEICRELGDRIVKAGGK